MSWMMDPTMCNLGVVGIPSPTSLLYLKTERGTILPDICAPCVATCPFGGKYTMWPLAASGFAAPDLDGMDVHSSGTLPAIFKACEGVRAEAKSSKHIFMDKVKFRKGCAPLKWYLSDGCWNIYERSSCLLLEHALVILVEFFFQ